MHPRKIELIAENLEIMHLRLPDERSWPSFVRDPDDREDVLARDPAAARAWGWIESADLTVVELLDVLRTTRALIGCPPRFGGHPACRSLARATRPCERPSREASSGAVLSRAGRDKRYVRARGLS